MKGIAFALIVTGVITFLTFAIAIILNARDFIETITLPVGIGWILFCIALAFIENSQEENVWE